jgi:hypothetical protein
MWLDILFVGFFCDIWQDPMLMGCRGFGQKPACFVNAFEPVVLGAKLHTSD